MESTTRMSALRAMSQIKFVPWVYAMKAIKSYIEKTTGDLNQDIELKKGRAEEIIAQIADFTAGLEVGTTITLAEYERYVNLHKQLRDAMARIRDASQKINHEIQGAIHDHLKLLDRRRPRYLKFLKKEPVPEPEDTPLTMVLGGLFSVILLAILWCFALDYDVYSLGNDFSVLSYTSF